MERLLKLMGSTLIVDTELDYDRLESLDSLMTRIPIEVERATGVKNLILHGLRKSSGYILSQPKKGTRHRLPGENELLFKNMAVWKNGVLSPLPAEEEEWGRSFDMVE